MMKGLTKKQREILDFIDEYNITHRYAPSYREIADRFGFSSLGSVYNHLRSLKKKGAVRFEPGAVRSLLVEKQQEVITSRLFPLIGLLKPGIPPELFSKTEMISLPNLSPPANEEFYLLRVEGDGSAEDLIQQGDLLLIVPRSPEPGETVLALINSYTSLIKRVFFDIPYIRFESSNPQVQPIIVREDHVEIQGVVISLIRTYSS